ncbi:MAG: MBL fold metallo-hydrolase [Gammaproteobacteria bacterium]|nr:MBL fold metallo-hydrolase [Gammaproteobacteria bacterium]MCZ6894988.1 MBL fold metallo-hydrolase [Gammaproteobacteria bacterium]
MKVVFVIWSIMLAVPFAQPLQADSRSWTFSENNNRIIEAQRGSGNSRKAGTIKLTYYGHMAFKITSPEGLEILIDPWRNDPSGAWGLWFPQPFPEISIDAVLSTHAHFDHDAVYRPHSVMVLERLAGELSLGDVKLFGLADKHVCSAPGWYEWHLAAREFDQDFCPPRNHLHMDNFVQVIETGGLRIAHWGDNRPHPARFVDEALKGVDVLILPVDDSLHLLSEADIDAAIQRYRPKIVIPAHYRMKIVSSVLTTLGTAEQWVEKQKDVVRMTEPYLFLNPEEIASFDRRVIYFGDVFARE